MANPNDPIDWTEALAYVAAARSLPHPNDAQIAEMRRVLGDIRPEAVRQALKNWLTNIAANRLPWPSELVGPARDLARVQAASERDAAITREGLTLCPECAGAKWVEATIDSYKPCRRCLPETRARWAAGHYLPDHRWETCLDCSNVRKHTVSAPRNQAA